MSSYKLNKILLVGAAGVRKTDFFEIIYKNRFASNYKLTVGVDILSMVIEFRPGEYATLSIWDIGGQQRFDFIRSTFLKHANGIIGLFDLTKMQTFTEVCEWIAEIRKVGGFPVPFLLIGNTANLIETKKPAIDRNIVRQFVDDLGGMYLEALPENIDDIKEAISEMTRRIITARR